MAMAAQEWNTYVDPEGGKIATIQSLEGLFRNVIGALVALAGVALFIMLIIGGFNFLFSGGDQKKLEQAKGTMNGAIAGLVVIVAAYLVLKTISIFTGVDVTQFVIPSK